MKKITEEQRQRIINLFNYYQVDTPAYQPFTETYYYINVSFNKSSANIRKLQTFLLSLLGYHVIPFCFTFNSRITTLVNVNLIELGDICEFDCIVNGYIHSDN